jgi:hypothetical protein
MTQEEAHQIEQAAIMLLRTVKAAQLASDHVIADTRTLRLDDEFNGRISLRTARELLERIPAWTEKG